MSYTEDIAATSNAALGALRGVRIAHDRTREIGQFLRACHHLKMAKLPSDPKGAELEDVVAAHFVSRGCYVETGVKERSPDELLELDIVWTDYRREPEVRHPVEVKSGSWGLGDLFKFYGWTRYLRIEPGEFVHAQPCGRVKAETIAHVEKSTGIRSFICPHRRARLNTSARSDCPHPFGCHSRSSGGFRFGRSGAC